MFSGCGEIVKRLLKRVCGSCVEFSTFCKKFIQNFFKVGIGWGFALEIGIFARGFSLGFFRDFNLLIFGFPLLSELLSKISMS
ncbi:hypothetical protein FACS1894191_5850 [Clostridia bacterium]|nr:hypothetical protein FACS1894191_5850 [Clostridia bacterium]